MKLSVVGVGYVGLVAAAGFAEGGNHVICVDNDPAKIATLKAGKIPIYEPSLAEIVQHNQQAGRLTFTTDIKAAVEKSLVIFLAVGTPSAPDGSADISAILQAAQTIARYMNGYRILVTKSTVPVGTYQQVHRIVQTHTCEPFDYVSNPEFLKEGSAVEDFLKPDRVIIGTDNPAVLEIMKQLYAPFMRKSSRLLSMDPASAEMTKYAANAMLAARISFMNEMSRLCECFGADIEMVRAGIGSDSRIGNAFLFPGVGYGGSCFPKDVRALIKMGQEQQCPLRLVEAVQQVNLEQQDRFARRIIAYFSSQSTPVNLAVWGLAFKAKTDDVRESPALYAIRRFLQAGFQVKAYDPEAGPNALQALNHQIESAADSYAILEQADALVIFTDWQEFRSPDFDAIAKKLRRPVIFDGRNLFDPKFVKRFNLEYYSIGRPS